MGWDKDTTQGWRDQKTHGDGLNKLQSKKTHLDVAGGQ